MRDRYVVCNTRDLCSGVVCVELSSVHGWPPCIAVVVQVGDYTSGPSVGISWASRRKTPEPGIGARLLLSVRIVRGGALCKLNIRTARYVTTGLWLLFSGRWYTNLDRIMRGLLLCSWVRTESAFDVTAQQRGRTR